MGEILQNKYGAFRRCLAFLLSIVMVLSTMTFTAVETDADSSSELSVSGWTVTIGDQTITDATSTSTKLEFSEGDDVSIVISWNFDDVVVTDDDYKAKIDLGLSGIVLSAAYNTLQELYVERNKIGEWYIDSDGVLQVTLYAAYLATTGKRGGFTIDGYVDLQDSNKDQSGNYTVKIFDETFIVNYTPVAGYANVSKSLGSVSYNGNTLTQNFTLTITAKEGAITLTDVSDTLVSGYDADSISGITLTTSSGTYTYTTWADLESGLEIYAFMAEDETYTITYSATVSDVTNAFLDSSSTTYENKASVSYTDESGNYGTKTSTTNKLNITSPYVKKTAGEYNETNGTITWTITVYLGDLVNLTGFDRDNVVITDILGSYLDTTGGSEVSLKFSDFNTTDNITYTYTYTTRVSDAVASASTSVTASNTVEVRYMDGVTRESTGYKTISKSILNKTCDGYDASTGLIKWTVTVDVPSDVTLTNVTVTEQTYNNIYFSYMEIEGQRIYEYNSTTGTGGLTDYGSSIISSAVISTSQTGYVYFTFTDAYIAEMAGKTITITVFSDPDDSTYYTGNEYTNKASLSYVVDGVTQSEEKSAVYKVPAFTLDKSVLSTDNGEYLVNYQIKVDLYELYNNGEISVGGEIKITDLLDEDMEYDADSFNLMVGYYGSNGSVFYDNYDTSILNQYEDYGAYVWNSSYSEKAVEYASIVIDANSLTISNIFFTEQMSKYLTCYSCPLCLVIQYTASLSDDGLINLSNTSTHSDTYTNEASLYVNDTDIENTTADVTFNQNDIIDKSGTAYTNYNSTDGLKVDYVVYVNPDELEIGNGITFTATDKMGSALALVVSSLTVEASDDNGTTWNTLTAGEGKDYTFTYDIESNVITLTLPDKTYLKISYTAALNVNANTTLSADNAKNTFSVGVDTSWCDNTSETITTSITNTNGWAESAQIKVYKCADDGSMTALANASFEVYGTKDDENGGYTVDYNNVYSATCTTGSDGLTTISIDGSQIYENVLALVETSAPSGYSAGEPLYFVLLHGPATSTYTDAQLKAYTDKGVYIYYSGTSVQIAYLNTVSTTTPTAQITVNKTGSDTGTTLLPGASFKLTLVNASLSGVTVSGTSISSTSSSEVTFTTNSESTAVVLKGLVAGTYTLEETSAPEGYTKVGSVTIVVDSNGNVTSITGIDSSSYSGLNTAAATLNLVDKAVTGSIAVSKQKTDKTNLSGAKLQLVAEKTTTDLTDTSVIITNVTDRTAGASNNIITFVTGSDNIAISGLPVGTYTLSEITPPSGYVVADSVTFKVLTTGEIEIVSYGDGNNTSSDTTKYENGVVTMTDAYEAKKMSISLTKVDESGSYISGVVFGLYSDVDCTNELERITTNASGYATTTGEYGEGTYYLKEISVPTNTTVELSTNVYKVVITQNTTEISLVISGNNVSYINTSIYSITNNNTSMYIYKTDEENNYVSGAVLKISTTDTNIDLTGVTVSGGATKTDATNANGSTLTLTTNGTGEIKLTGIPTGSYTLEEVSVPVSGGYAKADTVAFTVSLSTDPSNYGETLVTVTTVSDTTSASGSDGISMIDNSLGTITINKVDATDTSSLLGGATLTVTASDTNVDLTKYVSTSDVSNATGVSVSSSAITFTTESGSSVVIKNLPEGEYTLSESATGVPTGYKQADDIVFNVSVSNGTTTVTDKSGKDMDNATLVMEDAPVGSVTIRKYAVNNAGEKVLLEGAVLKITADASNTNTDLRGVKVSDVKDNTWTVADTNNSYDTLVFTTNGANITLSNLPAGTYTLAEDTPPAGYTVAYPIPFTVTVDGSGASTVTVGGTTVTSVDMEDKATVQTIGIRLRKQDSDGNSISGVVFGIYTDISCSDTSYVCSMTSGLDGYATSTTELEPGTYYLKETSVPDNYELSGAVATITVTRDLTDITYSISGGNSDYNSDDNYYYIKNYKLTMYINKVDGSSNSLSGATLKISTTDTNIDLTNVSVENVADYTAAKSYIQFTTNGDQVEISGIPVGDYTLEEVSTPDTISVKYVKADTITFKVSRDTDGTLLLTDTRASNTDTTTYISSTGDGITMVDYEVKTIAIKIHKVNELGNNVSGVVFGIYDENGTLLETMTATDDNGDVTSTNSYPDGTYYIKEITPASGYIPSTTEYKVVITQTTTEIKLEINGDDVTTTSYEIVNTRTSVQISKVDATSQKELEGAKIQIIGENGVVVAEWISSTSPTTIYGLATGKTYTLKEEVAPEGYDLTTDTTFILNADGTINTTATTTTIGTTGTLAGVLLVEDYLKATTTETTTETTTATTTTAPESTTAATTTAPESTTAATTTAPESTTAATTTAPESTTAATTTAPESTIAATTTAAETEATTEAAETTTVSEGDSNLIVEVLDEDTGEPVEGAVVRITDEDGNTVDLVTGKDGKVYGDFEVGEYTIEVISVPDGYTVTTGQKTTVTLVENETAEHQAIVSKLDGAQLGDSDSGILPITGMLVWPISVLSILGALFMVGGVIDNKRRRTK